MPSLSPEAIEILSDDKTKLNTWPPATFLKHIERELPTYRHVYLVKSEEDTLEIDLDDKRDLTYLWGRELFSRPIKKDPIGIRYTITRLALGKELRSLLNAKS